MLKSLFLLKIFQLILFLRTLFILKKTTSAVGNGFTSDTQIYIYNWLQTKVFLYYFFYQNSNSSTLYKKTKNVHKTEILAHIIISFIHSL